MDSVVSRSAQLEQAVPGIAAARSYQRRWLRSDVIAGVVLAAILVPQGMAYAELAGLPPVTGLYTTIACLAGYALFGPSRVLVLGPDSSVSPMILAAITPLLLSGGDPNKAIALAGMLALIVGIIEIVLGIGKLGFVADLLSSEVQVGYMNGLAVTIIVGQLPKLFGFSTDADSFFGDVREFFKGLDQTETGALIVGVGVLLVLLLLPHVTRRLPAVLVAVVGATVISAIFDLAGSGVATVGSLPAGVPATVGAVDLGGRRAAAAHRRARHHARLPDRHHRDVVGLRGPSRRGGQAEPGNDRDRCGERRGGVLQRVRGVDEWIANRSRGAVGREDAN